MADKRRCNKAHHLLSREDVVDVDSTATRAGVYVALAGGLGRGKIRADQGLEHLVTIKAAEADVPWVLDGIALSRKVHPSVVPTESGKLTRRPHSLQGKTSLQVQHGGRELMALRGR